MRNKTSECTSQSVKCAPSLSCSLSLSPSTPFFAAFLFFVFGCTWVTEAPWLRRMPTEPLIRLRLPWLPDPCTELRNKTGSVSLQRGNKGAPEDEGPLTLRWAELRFTAASHLSLPLAPYSVTAHFFIQGSLHSINTTWGPSLPFRSTQNRRDGKDTSSQVRKICFLVLVLFL